ncbi:MAG: translational GTPase TypA [Proteobacteria bacterium]|nr:translational GTPase TypA [Pseudomonadota bacterium]
MEYRNVAIIAHVDHGKTTLVDALLKQSGSLDNKRNVVERVMDSNQLERERGITITGKATSVMWKGVKINIADTPGHADFGGEVERMLTMVDGVVLLVDAAEGPLPQTRFVLMKALEKGLSVIVVINKIDRQDARCAEVLDEVYSLFIDLGANDEQIEFPVLYAIARDGVAGTSPDDIQPNLGPIFDAIIEHIPAPKGDPNGNLQALVTNTDYDNYLGKLAVGRVFEGTLTEDETLVIMGEKGNKQLKVGQLYVFDGLDRQRVKEAKAGELFLVAGIDEIAIGDTLSSVENPVALPRVRVDEPTIAMFFSVNNGPFAGKEGKLVTTRHIAERLWKEARANVSLRVEETDSKDTFKVIGRGELSLSILIETMRREGFEMCISKPEVVTKRDERGKLLEPMERLILDLPEINVGAITQMLALRKGIMDTMRASGTGRAHVEFDIPSRGLIGFRSQFLNETRGLGIMNTLFAGWAPWHGPMNYRQNGALVADRDGKSIPYALFHLQPRGILFVGPGIECYEGMIVGENSRPNDIDVNVSREKKLSNMRAAGRDDNIILTPPKIMSLEESIEWIDEDELVEVTPVSIRLRKRYLTAAQRVRYIRSVNKAEAAEQQNDD